MQQYECGYCGYDMTGVERFSNTVEAAMMQQFSGTLSTGMQGLYTPAASNSVKCPKCGRGGYWINHI